MTDPTELQVEVGGLMLGDATDYGVYGMYGLLGSVEANIVAAGTGYTPGHVFSHSTLPPRDFGFTVEVDGATDRATLRDALASLHEGGGTVRFNLDGVTVERLTDVVLVDFDPESGDDLELSSGLYRYVCRFRAGDPIIYTDTATVLNLNTAGTASGTVTNAGNYGPLHLPGAGWSCVITAGGSGCTGPKLVNGHASLSGAGVLDLHDVSLTAGQTVTVTASTEQVVKGSTSVFSSCRGASAGTLPEFFPLLPGAQTVTLSCATGACTAAFTYRSTRL